MSRARELARLGNANAIAVDTSNNVGFKVLTTNNISNTPSACRGAYILRGCATANINFDF